MNIFVVDNDPIIAARNLCDRHVVKMVLESAQMLSTAHRVLDGSFYYREGKNERKIPSYVHPNSYYDANLLLSTMSGHPCTRWVMESRQNYEWLFVHGYELCLEYTRRYEKTHKLQNLYIDLLHEFPNNIHDRGLTIFAQAMPDQYKDPDAVTAYRNYYVSEKARFAKWKNGKIPEWYVDMLNPAAIMVA